jgi:uncharacterized protein YbaA (DUF1428 family)
MTYVDGFVLPVKKNKIAAYCAMSRKMGKWMRKQGVIGYYECAGDELNIKWSSLKYKKMARAKAGETVVFAFIIYKSKAQRKAINAKMMKNPSLMPQKGQPLPFDMKRMAVGGFNVIVDQ